MLEENSWNNEGDKCHSCSLNELSCQDMEGGEVWGETFKKGMGESNGENYKKEQHAQKKRNNPAQKDEAGREEKQLKCK